MVIFLPMLQFGCFNASSNFTCFKNSLLLPRNGPPDAVNRIFSMESCVFPCNDWKIAECSLSTGRIDTPFSFASGIMICPAVTRVSLFARAISFPALIAATVGRIPIIPTIAVTNISDVLYSAISISPSMPDTTRISISFRRSFNSSASFSSHRPTISGRNSLACFSNKSMFLPADKAQIFIS